MIVRFYRWGNYIRIILGREKASLYLDAEEALKKRYQVTRLNIDMNYGSI